MVKKLGQSTGRSSGYFAEALRNSNSNRKPPVHQQTRAPRIALQTAADHHEEGILLWQHSSWQARCRSVQEYHTDDRFAWSKGSH